MKFKVARLKAGSRVAFQPDGGDNSNKFEKIDNFYCFKIMNYHEGKKKGVLTSDEKIQMETSFVDEMGGKGIVSIAFLLFNTYSNTIFYTVKKELLNKIMRESFLISTDLIDFAVSIDKLEKITQIKVVEYTDREASIFDTESKSLRKDIQEVTGTQVEAKKEVHIFEYDSKYGIPFIKQNLRKMIDNEQFSQNKGIYIQGLDINNNSVEFSKYLQLSINILENIDTVEKEDELSFNEIIEEIERVNL